MSEDGSENKSQLNQAETPRTSVGSIRHTINIVRDIAVSLGTILFIMYIFIFYFATNAQIECLADAITKLKSYDRHLAIYMQNITPRRSVVNVSGEGIGTVASSVEQSLSSSKVQEQAGIGSPDAAWGPSNQEVIEAREAIRNFQVHVSGVSEFSCRKPICLFSFSNPFKT